MRKLVCLSAGRFEYATAETPEPGKSEALLRICRVGICGTDLHAFEGTQPYFTYPRILGHELAGELIHFEDAPGFNVGEIVTILPYLNCGVCIACRKGKPNCCVHMKVLGVHVDGGMVEYLSVPTSSLVHGAGLTMDELALVEPLAIGAHGVRRAGVDPGEFVLVIGAGPIGIATMEFARLAGGKVIALDVDEHRLRFCRDRLGMAYAISAQSKDVTEQIREITNGDMPAVVIDATGNSKAINKAFEYMSHGGRYILIGLQKGDVSFSHPEFHKREGTLMSSRNATRQDFEYVIASIKAGSIEPANYITHRVGFEEVKSEFGEFLNSKNGVIKAMIEVDE